MKPRFWLASICLLLSLLSFAATPDMPRFR
jgi:hypothetical protein